jgi:cytochrome P450
MIRLDEVDLSSGRFWARPAQEREAAFTLLRRDRPLPFFAEPDIPWATRGPGYYAVTRHADIVEVSRQPDIFSSAQGVTVFDPPPQAREFFDSMINMDDPRHARLRRIVSRGFTRQRIAKLDADIARTAARIVDAVIDRGRCDFVTEVAAKLPLIVICDLMGVPEDDYEYVAERTDMILGAGDPDCTPSPAALFTAAAELAGMVKELAADRARTPRNDLTSALIHADLNGDGLTAQELGSFFSLLLQAGTETTRNALSHGLIFLTDYPEQKRRWAADYDGHARTAVEEILRLASPIIYMRRTVTQDCRLAGQPLSKGDKILLYYWSANRDETVFPEPHRFDITRDPNPHLTFGAPGPHNCLGAHLARREITVMFHELMRRVPSFHAVGEPDRLRSGFVNGIKHITCDFG